MIIRRNPIEHPPTRLKVVLMSGLSDPSDCALSQIQRRFLDRLSVPIEQKIYANFPYIPPERPEQSPVPILLASWRNLSQFLGAPRSRYRQHSIPHWQALAGSCQGLLVITISCGLQILNSCLASGIRPAEMEVLALGPVAWNRPPVPHRLIRGSRDYVVNPLFRSADRVLPGVGHMNYLDSPAVLELAEEQITQLQIRTSNAK